MYGTDYHEMWTSTVHLAWTNGCESLILFLWKRLLLIADQMFVQEDHAYSTVQYHMLVLLWRKGLQTAVVTNKSYQHINDSHSA